MVGVVFSRDRAMQLDALLRSFLHRCTDSSFAELHVLYATSSPRDARQYAALEKFWQARLPVTFHAERAFRADLLHVLAIPESTAGRSGASRRDLVLFVVDDNLFVRPFSLEQAGAALRRHRRAIGFSLRLGRNTTRSYPLDAAQSLPPFTPVEPGVLAFDWTRAEADFGYPLELSSSIYRARTVAGLLSSEDFTNPNTLELFMATAATGFRGKTRERQLLCFEQSVAFCNAVNRVQTTYPNRAGDSPSMSAAALADAFDAGLRIDVDALSDFTPGACHEEVPFCLAKDLAAPGSAQRGG